MPNYTDTLGFNKGTASFPCDIGEVSKYSVELDFAKIVAARAAAGATALVATDTLQVINLPAGAVVLSAGIRVTRAETTNTTATFSLGYTGGSPAAANAYASATPSNALGYGIAALTSPTPVTSADTIDLLLNTAVPANAVIKVFAIVANVS